MTSDRNAIPLYVFVFASAAMTSCEEHDVMAL